MNSRGQSRMGAWLESSVRYRAGGAHGLGLDSR